MNLPSEIRLHGVNQVCSVYRRLNADHAMKNVCPGAPLTKFRFRNPAIASSPAAQVKRRARVSEHERGLEDSGASVSQFFEPWGESFIAVAKEYAGVPASCWTSISPAQRDLRMRNFWDKWIRSNRRNGGRTSAKRQPGGIVEIGPVHYSDERCAGNGSPQSLELAVISTGDEYAGISSRLPVHPHEAGKRLSDGFSAAGVRQCDDARFRVACRTASAIRRAGSARAFPNKEATPQNAGIGMDRSTVRPTRELSKDCYESG